jgi:cytoskeleton protein RodZ
MPESIGQILKHSRTAKKLSLHQITKAIHIREEYLEAIEKDHPEELPSPVQGRGFIRLYWSHLGLDEQQLAEMMQPTTPSEPEIVTLPVKPSQLKIGFLQPHKKTPVPVVVTPKSETAPIPEPAAQLKKDNPPQPSDQVLTGIGNQLRDQRERLSLSLENIETYTHISVHYLKALEDGRMDQLPSPVQGRGMLNNYASFLDLDLDAVLMQYADALQLRREELEQEVVIQEKKKRQPAEIVKPGSIRSFFSLDIALVGLLVIAAFGALVWGTASILGYRQSINKTPTEIPISNLIIMTQTPTLLVISEPTLPELTNTSLPALVDLPTSSDLGLDATSQITPTVSGTPPTQGVYTVQLFIVAIQRTYMQVFVDGKSVFNGRTIPGNPYLYNGYKQIELICGNAAAIQITYNHTALSSVGTSGAVIHMIFSLDSYGTPTYTPTPTYTGTLRPSKTPRPSNTYPPTRTKTLTPTKIPTNTPRPSHTPLGTPAS